MTAAECILETLRGDASSHRAMVGAMIMGEAAAWLIGIGRALSKK